jgi:hypothetical protein
MEEDGGSRTTTTSKSDDVSDSLSWSSPLVVRLDAPRMASNLNRTREANHQTAAAAALMLCGCFEGGAIGTMEADRRPHELHMTLRLREAADCQPQQQKRGDRRLEGGVTAQAERQSGYRGAPSYAHPRASNGVTHWCELQQVQQVH